MLGAHAQHLSLALEFLFESMNALSWCSDYLYDYEQNGPSSDERDVNEEQNVEMFILFFIQNYGWGKQKQQCTKHISGIHGLIKRSLSSCRHAWLIVR